MSERRPKFTPGPWVEEHGDISHLKPDGSRYTSDIGDIAYVNSEKEDWKEFGVDTFEIRANGRLIASAPEMYELLAEVEPHLDEWNFPITLKARIEALLNKIDGVAE